METVIGNYTPAEYLKLHGTLPVCVIEEILDKQDQIQDLDGIEAHIQEGMTALTAEDMLAEQVSRLNALAKRLRGDNKQELNAIIESVEDFLQCQFNQADYGRDELKKAIAAIKKATGN